MASIYDRTDIYDLFDSPKKDAQTLSHRVKAEHQRPAGLLHLLKIPKWKWE